jgi:hypothetical protein
MTDILRIGVRLTAFALIAAGTGVAQPVIGAKAGVVYFVLGRVSIAGSGRLAIGEVNRQLNEGEVLFSEGGRAEVLLNPGAVLRIGEGTRIRMDSIDLTDTRVSIEAGSAVITVNQLERLDRVEIHIGGAVVVMKSAGEYRFDADRVPDAPRLRVFSGRAVAYRLAYSEAEAYRVAKRGQEVRFQDLRASKFDPKETDALQQWAETRGARPPWIPLAPMACYSTPTKLAEIKDWMRDCAQH